LVVSGERLGVNSEEAAEARREEYPRAAAAAGSFVKGVVAVARRILAVVAVVAAWVAVALPAVAMVAWGQCCEGQSRWGKPRREAGNPRQNLDFVDARGQAVTSDLGGVEVPQKKTRHLGCFVAMVAMT
jgi:hypothetical protein